VCSIEKSLFRLVTETSICISKLNTVFTTSKVRYYDYRVIVIVFEVLYKSLVHGLIHLPALIGKLEDFNFSLWSLFAVTNYGLVKLAK